MAFMSHREIKILVDELCRQNITGLQWIGSDAWITDDSLADINGHTLLIGSIGFTVRNAQIPGLGPFLQDVNPSQFPKSMFLKEFWENVFQCSLSPKTTQRSCNGSEHLKYVKHPFTDVSDLRYANNVYKAVYAIAHALDNLLSCKQQKGPFANPTCAHPTTVQPWQVKYLLNRKSKYLTLNICKHPSKRHDSNKRLINLLVNTFLINVVTVWCYQFTKIKNK